MSDIVEIVIKTIDESSGAVNNIDSAFAAMSAQLKELNQSMDVMNRGAGAEGFSAKTKASVGEATDAYSMFMGVQQVGNVVMGEAQKAYDMTIGKTLEYGQTIRTTSAILGQSTEETSRLIDVTDNFNISTGALAMGQKVLAKEGLSLNIDTIASLSDEYMKLNTQSEKTLFLTKNLGRSGLEFADAFNQGGKALQDMYTQTGKSMVLTQDQSNQLLDLSIRQKDVGDAWQGMANSITFAAIPAFERGTNVTKSFFESLDNQTQKGGLSSVFNTLTTGSGLVVAAIDAVKKNVDFGELGDAYKKNGLVSVFQDLSKILVNDVPQAATVAGKSVERLYTVTAPTAEQVAALSQQYMSQINMTMQIAQQTDAFSTAQNGLAEKIYATRTELDKTRGVYLQTGKHVTDLKSQLSDLQGQYDDNAAKNEENSNKQIYSDYLKMNSSKDLTYAAYRQEQDVAVALGITTDAERKKAESIFQLNQQMSDGKLTATAYADAIKQALAGTPSLSGVDAAKKWLEEHPTSAPTAAVPTSTASPTLNATAGTGMGQAQAWLESQKQAKATEDAAKKATSAMATDFATYSTTVSKQSDAAQKSVKSLLDTLTGLGTLGSFTITVTGNTTSGTGTGTGNATEYP